MSPPRHIKCVYLILFVALIFAATEVAKAERSSIRIYTTVDGLASIQTAEHSYLFFVTDPEERRGVLTGGALGFCSTPSVLLGANMGNDGQVSGLFSCLYEGSRADLLR